ncbi:MAG: cytochrome b/b6 domain-containing protein [Gammaproteobacteria bacterium]|nr:cytochrome b/b6 domain-containing protein [Gammaproteobacteria bacterium]
MTKGSSLYDSANSFGWISIALHWATALAVVVLWFIGKSILWVPTEELDARRSLHIVTGLTLWLLLAGRILWRLRVKHPRTVGQSERTHAVARAAHFLMLTALAIMLVSGPLMAWLLPERTALANAALAVHATTATGLMVMVVLHIGGALKHLMFHDDETIARIFVPRR